VKRAFHVSFFVAECLEKSHKVPRMRVVLTALARVACCSESIVPSFKLFMKVGFKLLSFED